MPHIFANIAFTIYFPIPIHPDYFPSIRQTNICGIDNLSIKIAKTLILSHFSMFSLSSVPLFTLSFVLCELNSALHSLYVNHFRSSFSRIGSDSIMLFFVVLSPNLGNSDAANDLFLSVSVGALSLNSEELT